MTGFWVCKECLRAHTVPTGPCDKCGSQHPLLQFNNPKGLGLDDYQRFLWDTARHGSPRAMQVHRWINSFAVCCKALAAESVEDVAVSTASLFWIRLHGVIVEVPEHLGSTQEVLDSLATGAIETGSQGPGSGVVVALTQILKIRHYAFQVRNALSEDQLIFADWRRHIEAHLVLNGYMLQQTNERGLKDSLTVKSLGRRVKLDEQWAAVERISELFGREEKQVAARFAERIEGPAVHLHLAAEEYWRRYGS